MKAATFIILAFGSIFAGCKANHKTISTIDLDTLYESINQNATQAPKVKSNATKRISYVADNLTVSAFCRYMVQQCGVSIVTQEGLDKQMVNMSIDDQPVEDVIAVLARRLGAQLTRVGHVYYIGTLRPEDKGVLVERITNRNPEQIDIAIKTVLSEYGRSMVFEDGTVVVGDSVEVIRRVHEILDSINREHVSTWYVQLIIITKQLQDEHGHGVRINDEINLTKIIADAASRNISVRLLAERYINAVVKLTATSEYVSISQTPAVIVNGAATARIESSDNIPVPKRAVNDQGEIIATTEYQNVTAGMIAEVKVSSVNGGGHSLAVTVESSDVIGSNGDAPIVRKQRLNTIANMGNEQLYLVGVYYKQRTADRYTGGLSNLTEQKKEGLAVEVWANVRQIR